MLEIKNLMNKFYNVLFSHMFQEGNLVTDSIAKQVVYRERKLRWQDDLCKEVELTTIANYDKTHTREGKIS